MSRALVNSALILGGFLASSLALRLIDAILHHQEWTGTVTARNFVILHHPERARNFNPVLHHPEWPGTPEPLLRVDLFQNGPELLFNWVLQDFVH